MNNYQLPKEESRPRNYLDSQLDRSSNNAGSYITGNGLTDQGSIPSKDQQVTEPEYEV